VASEDPAAQAGTFAEAAKFGDLDPHYEQGKPTMFLCGDRAEAKAEVGAILEAFGWEPCDCGGMAAARAIEPLCILWCIPGFLRGRWTHAFKLLTK